MNAGFHVGASPAGGGILSANLANTVGVAGPIAPGLNLGGAVTNNYYGSDVGQYAAILGRFGSPTLFANSGGNAPLMTPSAWSLCKE